MSSQSLHRETPIRKIPKDWEIEKLNKVFDVYGGTTPSTLNKEYWDGKILWVTPTDITRLNGNIYLNETEKKITDRAVEECSLSILHKDTLLLTSRATIGFTAINTKPVTINQGMTALTPKDKSKVYSLFYAYYFQLLKPYLEQLGAGSTFREVSRSSIKNIQLPLPPLPEQKKIAEILSTVDKAVEKVDEAIEKTERLKKGLMQELLTKGIGHKEFKNTEIGRIPKEWEVIKLGDEELTEIIMGQSPPSATYNRNDEGIPFLQGKAEFGEIYPSPIVFCSEPIKIAEPNDILISVRAPVGDVNIAPFRCCIGRGLASIRPKNHKIHHLYLFYFLKSQKRKMDGLSSGSTFKAIKKEDIENFLLPLPPLPEQKKIAEILGTVDKRLELLRKKKEKLERVKKGLMDDLLSGKKRVTNLISKEAM